MSKEYLQRFLDLGLLDVGDDVTKFDHVAQAADDLAVQFAADKRSLLRAAGVLITDGLAPGEEITGRCEAAIKQHWPTYRSRFASTPNELYRATLLQAIANLTADNIQNAAMVYYGTSSFHSRLAKSSYTSLFTDLLASLGATTERAAGAYWGASDAAAVSDIEYDGATIPISAVNPKALAEAIRNSAGPVPNVPASNPEWPTANSATWLDFFGKTVAEAVAGAIAAAHKDVVPKLLTQTRADNAKLAKTIRGANGDPADRLRTKLLYWNATLFSESRRQSYRLLSATDAAASAAFDLWGAVPDLHTLSVEYFLRETVRRAVGDSAATALVSLPNIASELQEENAIRADGDDDGGWSFRRTLRALADGTIDSASSYEQLGLPEQTRLSREDLAVWLFRDLQAERLSKWTS